MHRNVIFVHAKTLKETKYKLKTSMGISDEFYTNCEAFPIYGTGQGSGNSPAIWCIVSSVLFAAHEDKGHGAYFCSPDQEMSVSLSMIGFVADSTGQVNKFTDTTQPTPEFLRQIMQLDAQLWSDLLWLSGGLLKLGKCSFHQFHFDFDHDGQPMMRAGTYGSHLQRSSPSNSLIQPRKWGAWKYLEVRSNVLVSLILQSIRRTNNTPGILWPASFVPPVTPFGT